LEGLKEQKRRLVVSKNKKAGTGEIRRRGK